MDPRKDADAPKPRSGRLIAVLLVFIAFLIFFQVVAGSGIFTRTCTVLITPPVVAPGEPFSVALRSNLPLSGKADTVDYVVYGVDPWPGSSGGLVNGSGTLVFNGSRAAFVLKPDGDWYQFSEDTSRYDLLSGMSFPSPLSFSLSRPGNYTIDVLYTTSDRTGGDPTASLTVT